MRSNAACRQPASGVLSRSFVCDQERKTSPSYAARDGLDELKVFRGTVPMALPIFMGGISTSEREGPGVVVLLTLCLTVATGRAAGSLIVFGDSYADAGTAGHGIHQVIHTALTTPQLDVCKLRAGLPY